MIYAFLHTYLVWYMPVACVYIRADIYEFLRYCVCYMTVLCAYIRADQCFSIYAILMLHGCCMCLHTSWLTPLYIRICNVIWLCYVSTCTYVFVMFLAQLYKMLISYIRDMYRHVRRHITHPYNTRNTSNIDIYWIVCIHIPQPCNIPNTYVEKIISTRL